MPPTKRPWYSRGPFIASVGALAMAIVMAIGYAMDWPAEAYAIAAPIVGAALAVWRSGSGLAPDRRGMVRVETLGLVMGVALLAVFAALLFGVVGCSSTVKTHARQTTRIDVWPKSCRMTVDADGVRVFSLTADPSVKCSLQCPEGK